MLEDYLLPGEDIKWAGPSVQYGGEAFKVYVTSKRLLLYRVKGVLMKKEDVVSEKIKDIQNISLRQEGLISKIGILTIEMSNRKFQLRGTVDAIKTIYQNLMMYWEND